MTVPMKRCKPVSTTLPLDDAEAWTKLCKKFSTASYTLLREAVQFSLEHEHAFSKYVNGEEEWP